LTEQPGDTRRLIGSLVAKENGEDPVIVMMKAREREVA
jgi:hypothetical protein